MFYLGLQIAKMIWKINVFYVINLFCWQSIIFINVRYKRVDPFLSLYQTCWILCKNLEPVLLTFYANSPSYNFILIFWLIICMFISHLSPQAVACFSKKKLLKCSDSILSMMMLPYIFNIAIYPYIAAIYQHVSRRLLWIDVDLNSKYLCCFSLWHLFKRHSFKNIQ